MKDQTRHYRSLAYSIQAILMWTLIAVVLGAWAFMSAHEIVERRAALKAQSEGWVQLLALRAELVMASSDVRSAENLLQQTIPVSYLRTAAFYDRRGNRLALFRPAGLSEENALAALASPEPFGYAHFLLTADVGPLHDALGEVRVQIDLAPMWWSICKFLLSLAIFLGSIGVVVAWAARSFLHRAVLPTLEIKRVIDAVNSGKNYDLRVPVGSFDDVDEFAAGLNTMLEQIQERDRLLEINSSILTMLKEEAEQTSRTKSEFLALISHELRTPMAGVIGLLNLTLDEGLPQAHRERVELALKNAEALLSIVNDLLDLSKIEAGKLMLENIDFSLHLAVRDALGLMHERALLKNLSFSVTVAPDVPTYLRGDPTRLRQILVNLAGNALKFTDVGGVSVNVLCCSPRPGQSSNADVAWLRFEVIDTGIGMTDAVRSRLFQKFEQAGSSTSRKFGGTGLGLSICKQMVELMGGKIGVTSQLGEGSNFFFEVAIPMGQQPVVEEKPGKLTRHSRRLAVLVAEDSQTNQIIIGSLLEEMGHEVTMAENGQLAMQELSQRHFDMILMDGRMPVIDGLEATRHIRTGRWSSLEFSDRKIPIIALTANAGTIDRQNFLAAGMNDFLTKPVDRTELHKALQHVIDGLPVRQPSLEKT